MELTFEKFSKDSGMTEEYIWRNYFRKNHFFFKEKDEDRAVNDLLSIFNAILKLSNVMGFQAMSLRDLSKEANLSMKDLTNYVPSKDELLKIIYIHALNLIADIMKSNINDEVSPKQRMARAIKLHLYISEMMPQWFSFLYMEARNLKGEDRRVAMETELFTEKLFAEILADGIKAGVYADRNFFMTASVIKAMLQDWYLKKWKYNKRKISVDQYASFIIEFIESYLKI